MSDHQTTLALREANRIKSSDEYFDERPDIDCLQNRRIYSGAFSCGWAYRQPEIDALTARVAELEGTAK